MSVYEKVGGEFAVNSETAGDQTNPQITTFADGGFLVTWVDREPWPESGQVIKAQLYDASGARAGAEFQVNEFSTDGVFSQNAAVLADGTVVVTWINNDYSEGGPGGVRARIYDSAGNALGGEFGVNATHDSYKFNSEIAALSGGRFVVTWDDSAAGSQMAQVFDASGAKIGTEFATTTSFGYDGGYGDVVGLAGGGFVTSWHASDGDVYARLFDDSGVALGGAFKLNSLTADSQQSPNVTALASGGFVAIWKTWDTSQDGSSAAIKGQVFDAAGAKVGSEFLANQYGANLQSSATVTALPDGAFLVAWATYDWSQDGDGSAVKVRQFNADGTAAGGETLLNTVTAGGQFLPELATLSDGRIVAAWVGDGTDGDGYGIRAQFLYTSANAAPQITSDGGGTAAGFTLAENETAVTTVAAGDADGPQAVTYWIGGGADAGLFAIDKTTGALSFVAGPDFESPADADEDGVYEVIVEARDGLSVDTQAISVAVTDLADGLSFRYTSVSALENGLAGPTLLALGGGGAPVSYTIVGGADAALLALDAQTGELSFLAEQDREAPGDADGDGVYEVEVTADDGTSSVTRTISVTLANVNEGQVFLSGTEWTVAENEYLAATVVAADIDGDTLEYGVIGGADGWLFGIGSDGLLGFNEPADFEAPLDADGDNVYEVEVTAYDGDLYATQLLTITVTDAEDPLPPAFARTAFEVSEIVYFSAALELTGGVVDVYYSIVGGADSWLFNIDSYTGELSMIFGAFDYESPYDSNGDNLYEIQVEAYDYNTDDAVTGTVTVAVRDAVNEELFFVSDDDWAAVENETYVGAVTAYDAQYDALTYSVTGGADGALFTIVPETGELFFLTAPVLAAPGDADGDNVYELEVAVTDGMSTEYQLLTVTLGDVGQPGFAQTAFTTDENQEASAVLEASAGGAWTYSITGGADAGQFVLDSGTGEITFLGGDFEAPYDADGDNVYEVEVTADSGSDAVTETVTFAVQNVNETPTFVSGPDWYTYENSAWLGYLAYDPEGDALSFSVTGGADAQRFTLDEQTGLLSFVTAPDFEAPADADGDNVYEIAVMVTDGVFTANETFLFTVGNLLDTLTFQQTVFSAPENATTAGSLRVDGAHSGVLYQITGGADAALFTIGGSPSNRQLAFASGQDFENPGDADGDGVYEVQVKATYGSATVTETMFVTLTDRAEAPVIVSNGGGNFGSAAVGEGATAVTTVAASDPDGNAVTYAITGGPDAARFAIDAATGALAFVTAPDFETPGDADANNTYEVTVRASDGGLSDTQTLFVHVANANEAPVITSNGGGSSGAIAISENSTAVTTVAATDAEGGVTYAIGGGADAALFTIDAATGTLGFVTAPDYDAPADADGDNVYDVVVSADDGTLSDTQALAISVGNVNEGPVITSNGGGASAALSLLENSTAVTTVVANDADGAVTYSVFGEDSEFFTIDASSGVLSFNGAPDFDSPNDFGEDNVYEVVVRAHDGAHWDTQALSITVGDVEEAPVILSTTDSLNENHTFVGSIWADDSDNDPLTYSVVGGADGGLFTVNWEGEIYFRAAPDFEAPGDAGGDNVYELIVGVSDGTTMTTGAITVTVNNLNEAPDIVSNGGSINADIAVSENATAVTTVVAFDPEGGVNYSLAGHDAALFTLDAVTGVLQFIAAPDFETPGDVNGDNRYDLSVTASDGTFSVFQHVYVHVGNANEAPVIASNSGGATAAISLSENATVVTTVAASDVDSEVTYALAGGADAALFAIDATTGALGFLAAPNFEAPTDADGDNVYEVVVRASDGSLSDTQALSIAVQNLNEGVTITSPASASVLENGTTVATVTASDLDGDAVTFSLLGGADAALFALDAETGALSFVTAPDFEAPADADGDNVYEVVVGASDGSLSDSQALSVTVGNVNEAPTIVSDGGGTSAALELDEGQAAVTTVVAADADGSGALAYAITGGPDAALFAIDAATGALTLVAAPDYEAPADEAADNFYNVTVTASDGELSTFQAISVLVRDINEGVTITSAASAPVLENATAVTTVTATDLDGDAIAFALAGGADADRFAIDAASGALSFLSAPNFEAPADADGDNVYDVLVRASDGSFTDTQALSVTVGNLNEAPVITSGGGGATAAYALEENSLVVGMIAAGDAEGGVTYALAGGADAAHFAIDTGTGALSFVAAPDFDAPADAGGDNVYEVIVSASDGSLTDTQALAITVGNESDGLTLTGTSQANTLNGSHEEDTISGLGGNDTLRGLGAADVLNGGDGQDRLYGGTGADVLTGGLKADIFEFDALGESTVSASDRIVDFSRSQGDKISLSDIDANELVASNQAFNFIGTAAFSNQAGQLRYFQQNGDTFVAGDVDGNGVADFQIVVDPLVSFIASDFIL